MSKETVIQSITVGLNPQRTFTVGEEVNGRVVIQIDKYVDRHGSEFHVLDEDGELIARAEYLPAIIDYKLIAVDDSDESSDYLQAEDLPF